LRGGLTLCVLACLTAAACGCAQEPPKKAAEQAAPAPPPAPIPAHRVCDIDESSNGVSVSVFTVVDPNLSVEDAWAIFRDYEKRYPRATVALNVDLFCDSKYAHHRFLNDPSVSDRQYYAHVLYSFTKAASGVEIFTRGQTDAFHPGVGTACR